MAELEKVPTDLHRAMFRIAAIAFLWATVVDVAASYVGSSRYFNFGGIWIVAALSCAGALVSWFLPWHRLPVQRFLSVIVLPGLGLLTAMLIYTGGIHSHVLPLFVAPAVFMAAAYGLRTGSLIAVLTIAAAALPLFLAGWDDFYARSLIVLAGATALSAYIPARVRRALTQEYESRRGQQEESYVATIGALAAALDAKDRYTEAHSQETAGLAVSVGRRLGIEGEPLRFLEYGALLHDIGKIGIPGYVLHKPGPLTPDEYEIMKEHPVIGERILASVPFLAPLCPIVRAEHERWDGNGYPDGLRGEEIPLESRIIHACDAYHSMATDRAYRKALSREKILTELRVESGKQFDPRVVEVMLRLIQEENPEMHALPQEAGRPAPASPVSGPRSWAQHLEMIESLGARLSRVTGIQETCRMIGETIVAIVPHDQCRIRLVAPDGNSLQVTYVAGPKLQEYESVTPESLGTVRIGEGITGWVAETKRGVVTGDSEHHAKARHVPGTPYIEESMIAVPVVFEDGLLGVIAVVKLGLNQYSLDHLRLLTILANQAAVSIANARLIDRLESSARTDPLTGLASRAALEEAFERELATPLPSGFSIVMLDVENLKQVNDAHGHLAGDEVLKRVAGTLRANLGRRDVAGRWLSDDFVVLLPGLTEPGARALGQKIWTALASPPNPADMVSINWGTAAYPDHGKTRDDLITWAERSMRTASHDIAA
jgi:diguanylate cyclase (GGDEF)-like protein